MEQKCLGSGVWAAATPIVLLMQRGGVKCSRELTLFTLSLKTYKLQQPSSWNLEKAHV